MKSSNVIQFVVAATLLALIATGCGTLRTGSLSESLVLTSASSPPGLLAAIRTTLAAESWQPNRRWTAIAEWEHRQSGFPIAGDLRWEFSKAWDGSPARKDAAEREQGRIETSSDSTVAQKLPPKDKATDSKAAAAATPPQADGKAEPGEPGGNAPPWDGFWPLTVSDLIGRGRGRGEGSDGANRTAVTTADDARRCLKRLARSDNLAGWNAAILWARHDPSAAIEVADVLERLVSAPSQYVAETGERYSPLNAATDSSKQNPVDKNAPRDQGRHDKQPPERSNPPVAKKSLSMATRSAAAEAWCLVLAAAAHDPIDGLAPAGRLLERAELPNEIRGELFRGVARWVRPRNIPRLENALRETEGRQRPPLPIRQAAIDACLVHAIWNRPSANGPSAEGQTAPVKTPGPGTVWPATVMNCRIDPDYEVRRTFLRWLGWARPNPEGAFELLKRQSTGADLELRITAMESLAALHTDEARAELKAEAAKTRDVLRATAVSALAAWGLKEVTPFAHDASLAVRVAVARELGKYPALDSAVRLSELVVDRSVDVQLAAVGAVKQWPDALALPLLLRAMRDSAAKARLDASQSLAARRRVAREYRFDAPPEERDATVTAIAAELGSSLSYLDQLLRREPSARGAADEIRAREIRGQLAALLENPAGSPAANAAREWLAGIGARDVAVVEAFLQEPTRAPPDRIYRDVLPKLSPLYAALVELESTDVNIRRRGAKLLADRGQEASLSRPVLRKLFEVLPREQDVLVWRFALLAVFSDATDECADVATLALGHGSPEVRELGCDHLARHGRSADAVPLLELLEDRSRNVRLAAVRALGNCGNQIAVRGLPATSKSGGRNSTNLRDLLIGSDQELRFAAAVSLCRLGAPEGMQELLRYSYDPRSQVRERAVNEMGLSGQTRFVEHLVSLGWTERNDQVRRAILTALDRLVPPEIRPPRLGDATALDAKMRLWAQWLERSHGKPRENLRAGAPLATKAAPGT